MSCVNKPIKKNNNEYNMSDFDLICKNNAYEIPKIQKNNV